MSQTTPIRPLATVRRSIAKPIRQSSQHATKYSPRRAPFASRASARATTRWGRRLPDGLALRGARGRWRPFQTIDRTLYLAAATTGLRKGKLVALRWLDVDLEAGRIRVRRNFVCDEFGTPKSRRSSRSVPITRASPAN